MLDEQHGISYIIQLLYHIFYNLYTMLYNVWRNNPLSRGLVELSGLEASNGRDFINLN